MSNNYFNINEYSYNTVIHCKTVKEVKTVLDYLKTVGHPWCPDYNGKNAYAIAKETYSRYCENTCINFKFDSFASMDFYKREDYVILEFDDFDWFSVNDIKDGMLVVTSNGERYVKLSHFLVGDKSYIPLSAYDYSLCNTNDHHKDIIAVYSSNMLYPYNGVKELFSYNCNTDYAQSHCVYEKRHPVIPRKLTISQIEEKLGYPIEVVRE